MEKLRYKDIKLAYRKKFGSEPEIIAQAPGRVNLLGEHVDYNDGFVLPAAINRSVIFASSPRADNLVHIHPLDLGKQVVFDLANLEDKRDIHGGSLPAWALYPAGVAWALTQKGYPVRGLNAVYRSNVPIGAGLSSSAAIEVGFAILWNKLGAWQAAPLEIAQVCQRAENAYVGVSCGLMDQFASACGVEGHALYFDTRTLAWEKAPVPGSTSIVIADSGVRRSLTTSAYNERRAACETAVDMLKQYMPHIGSLRDVPATEFAAFGYILPETIRKRAEHVVKEIARVQSAFSALQRDDRRAFGALMYAGHKSLRDLYEVSTPELDLLVALSRDITGIIGARLTGAGFGGCTVNLVESEKADAFIDELSKNYSSETGREAKVYLCQASEGAHILAPA